MISIFASSRTLAPLLIALSAACSSSTEPADAARADATAGRDGGSPDASADTGVASDAAGRDSATSDSGPSPYTGALVHDDCGPADGPAIRVLLYGATMPTCRADPDLPSLDFYIYSGGFPPAPGSTYTDAGVVTSCPGGTPPCRTSSNFSVTFDSYSTGGGATGSYLISWGSDPRETGTFDAQRCEIDILCG